METGNSGRQVRLPAVRLHRNEVEIYGEPSADMRRLLCEMLGLREHEVMQVTKPAFGDVQAPRQSDKRSSFGSMSSTAAPTCQPDWPVMVIHPLKCSSTRVTAT